MPIQWQDTEPPAKGANRPSVTKRNSKVAEELLQLTERPRQWAVLDENQRWGRAQRYKSPHVEDTLALRGYDPRDFEIVERAVYPSGGTTDDRVVQVWARYTGAGALAGAPSANPYESQ